MSFPRLVSPKPKNLEERLSEPKHRNWIKGVLVLKELKGGLENFVQENIKEVKAKVIQTIRQQLQPGEPIADCDFCTGSTLNKRRHHCPSKICSVFYDVLSRYHRKQPRLDNVNVIGHWRYQSWEITKYFLGKGYQHVTCAADTDCAGLLTAVINCKLFHRNLNEEPSLFEEVKELRNHLMHSPDLHFEVDDLEILIEDICRILNDDRSLGHNGRAQKAVHRVKEIEAMTLTVSSIDYKALYEGVAQELGREIDGPAKALRQLRGIPNSQEVQTDFTNTQDNSTETDHSPNEDVGTETDEVCLEDKATETDTPDTRDNSTETNPSSTQDSYTYMCINTEEKATATEMGSSLTRNVSTQTDASVVVTNDDYFQWRLHLRRTFYDRHGMNCKRCKSEYEKIQEAYNTYIEGLDEQFDTYRQKHDEYLTYRQGCDKYKTECSIQ